MSGRGRLLQTAQSRRSRLASYRGGRSRGRPSSGRLGAWLNMFRSIPGVARFGGERFGVDVLVALFSGGVRGEVGRRRQRDTARRVQRRAPPGETAPAAAGVEVGPCPGSFRAEAAVACRRLAGGSRRGRHGRGRCSNRSSGVVDEAIGCGDCCWVGRRRRCCRGSAERAADAGMIEQAAGCSIRSQRWRPATKLKDQRRRLGIGRRRLLVPIRR